MSSRKSKRSAFARAVVSGRKIRRRRENAEIDSSRLADDVIRCGGDLKLHKLLKALDG